MQNRYFNLSRRYFNMHIKLYVFIYFLMHTFTLSVNADQFDFTLSRLITVFDNYLSLNVKTN